MLVITTFCAPAVPGGVVTLIWVAVGEPDMVAVTPPIVTPNKPPVAKFVPVIVTTKPPDVGPDALTMLVNVGAAVEV